MGYGQATERGGVGRASATPPRGPLGVRNDRAEPAHRSAALRDAGERLVQAPDELVPEEVELLRPHRRPAGYPYEAAPLRDRLRFSGNSPAHRLPSARP